MANIYFDIFPIKNVLKQDALLPLLFNFAAVYIFKKVQANQEGLKLNGMNHNVVYAIDVNILGGSIHTIQKNTEGLVVTKKENGLEVNAEKTMYIVHVSEPACRTKSQYKDR
jgi:alpha-galactosidase